MALHNLFSVQGDFARTEDAMAHIVSLPLYPELSEDDALHIVKVFRSSVAKAGHRV